MSRGFGDEWTGLSLPFLGGQGSSSRTMSTVTENLAVEIPIQGEALSVDQSGQLAAVAGRDRLLLMELENPEVPPDTVLVEQECENAVVEFNPHVFYRQLLLSAENTKVLLHDVDSSSHQQIPRAHERPITDLSWSHQNPMLFASCSADSFINVWDLRSAKKQVRQFRSWTLGAYQVKWNRIDGNTIATSHAGELRIWDMRKSAYVSLISAHSAPVHGLDWSYTNENLLMSSSQDRFIKLWDIASTKEPLFFKDTGFPVCKAKFGPFGNSIASAYSRDRNEVDIWTFSNEGFRLVETLSGHNDSVNCLDWRTMRFSNQGIDNSQDDLIFQLMTTGNDNVVRFWYIDDLLQEECGRVVSSQQQNLHDPFDLSLSPSEFVFGQNNSSKQDDLTDDKSRISDISLIKDFLSSVNEIKLIEVNEENESLSFSTVNGSIDVVVSLKPREKLSDNGLVFKIINAPSISKESRIKLNESLNEAASTPANSLVLAFRESIRLLLTKVNSISFGESVVFDRVDRVDAPDSLLLPEQFDQGEELLDAQEADLEIRREDSSIPCPSLCGVSIGFQGQLICFQNMEISNDPFNKIRSYSDLKKNRRTLPFSKHSLKVQMLPDEDESNGADFDFFNSSEDALNQNQLSSATSGLMLNARSSPCLFIYDISKFLSINIYLAHNYRLYHEDLEEACLFNRSICQKNGNEDLYRVWELARLSAALYTRLSTASEKFMPWSHHPLGGRFIIRLIETHIHMGDYATASTILCLFGNILKGNSDWNVLKGVQGAQSYADFLYCHGLLFKRSELLKILRIRSSEDVPKVGSFCERCKQNSQICSICQKNPVICSICRNNVKGMSTFCLKCGHGGHLSHVRDWFSKNELCPSGCGCKCSMSLMN